MKTLRDSIVNKETSKRWDADLLATAPKCGRDEALSYEFHEFFPLCVFVELDTSVPDPKMFPASRREYYEQMPYEEHLQNRRRNFSPGEKLTFLSNSQSLSSADSVVWYKFAVRMRAVIRDYLMRRRPEPDFVNGIEGWIVPLCGSDNLETLEDFNEYMHNLMFWESMLDADQVGPLMMRYSWVAQRLYEHVYDMEEVKRRVWQDYPETREKNLPTLQKVFDAALKANTDKHRLIIIDEPEAGLHPAVVRQIMDDLKKQEMEDELAQSEARIRKIMTQRMKNEEKIAAAQREAMVLESQLADIQNRQAQLRMELNEIKHAQNDKK